MSNEKIKFTSDEWICAHYGDDYHDQKGSVSTPIYQSSTHIFPTCKDITKGRPNKHVRPYTDERKYFYGRNGNPTVEVLEKKLAALERTDACLCTGSGMAAVTAVAMYLLKQGDHAIVVKYMYGSGFVMNFLSDYGVESTCLSGVDVQEIADAIQDNTKLIYLESPCSMVFKLQDLEAIGKIAKEQGIVTAIDNTWSTPINQKPHTLGIDLVVHSLSKYIGGHSDIIGGAIAGNFEHINGIAKIRSTYGGILHPQEAYLVLRGLRTLPVRMRLHQENGLKIAKFLENHPKVTKVFYPGLESHPQHELAKKQMLGFSSLMSILVETSIEKMEKFVDELGLFKIAVSWGGYESLIIAPRVHKEDEKLCYTRIFIGQDNIDDLMRDLDHCLEFV